MAVEAADRSGTIHVVVGPDGLPESVSVAAGWLRALGSERFGAAVGEAVDAALEQWFKAAVDALGPLDAQAPEPDPDAAPVPTRPLFDVLSEALDVMRDTAERLDRAAAAPRVGTGSAGFGKLVLVLSPDGTVSCTADPHWVSDQDPAALTDALNRALAGARDELARAAPALPSARLGDLAGELQATLRDVIRAYEPGGR
jgi:hypothetical protein